MSEMSNSLILALSLATACSLLSVIVVARRWAFIGEAISHSGFGGAGTAWLLMLIFPSLRPLQTSVAPYVFVSLFCIVTALVIGAIARSGRLQIDAAIGVFLTASLAWGLMAQQIFFHRRGTLPPMFDTFLYGQLADVSRGFVGVAVVCCLGVMACVAAFWKEIAAYSFDPLLAQTSGVPVRMMHYLLMLLLAMVVIVGSRVAGSVLVTALLVLPAATATQLSRQLGTVIIASIGFSVVAAIAGVWISTQLQYLPAGPLIVLALFGEFLIVYGLRFLIRPSEFNSVGG